MRRAGNCRRQFPWFDADAALPWKNLNREKGFLLPIKAMQIAASALIDTNQIKYLA